MWLEYVRLLPSSKYCVKYGVDWLEHWIFHMFSVISAFEVCHCQLLKKIYTRGRIICNWFYSIGTPKVFWHLTWQSFKGHPTWKSWAELYLFLFHLNFSRAVALKELFIKSHFSDWFVSIEHFRCPNWVKSIADDPALDRYLSSMYFI